MVAMGILRHRGLVEHGEHVAGGDRGSPIHPVLDHFTSWPLNERPGQTRPSTIRWTELRFDTQSGEGAQVSSHFSLSRGLTTTSILALVVKCLGDWVRTGCTHVLTRTLQPVTLQRRVSGIPVTTVSTPSLASYRSSLKL